MIIPTLWIWNIFSHVSIKWHININLIVILLSLNDIFLRGRTWKSNKKGKTERLYEVYLYLNFKLHWGLKSEVERSFSYIKSYLPKENIVTGFQLQLLLSKL